MISDMGSAIEIALLRENNKKLLELLSVAHENRLSETHSIAYALTAMMPPFEDYEQAVEVLTSLFGSKEEKVAAIFLGYLYVNLQPFDDSFVRVLKKYTSCSISNYILALYFDYEDDIEEALKYIHMSIYLSHFTKNIMLRLSLPSKGLQLEGLKAEISNLVQDKNYEKSPPPKSAVDFVDNYMKELVLGTYMTSINWDILMRKYKISQND